MYVNADFSLPAAVRTSDVDWIHSPSSGVDRKLLDRIGDEIARATSVVRYAPGSSFSRHEHELGEEFLVLEGVFSDEHGDFPVGTYVRNPPGTGHSPHSKNGCRILVKLRQFHAEDLTPVIVETASCAGWQSTSVEGVEVLALHQYMAEKVEMLRLGKDCCFDLPGNGVEVFVVSGSINCDGDYAEESWLRFPVGSDKVVCAQGDALLWVKSGHLPDREDQ